MAAMLAQTDADSLPEMPAIPFGAPEGDVPDSNIAAMLHPGARISRVAGSLIPLNQRSRAAVNSGGAPASMNRVSDERSFVASVAPKTCSAVVP